MCYSFIVCYVGPGDQGIVYEYRSKEFGDNSDPSIVLDAVRKIEHNKL